MARTYDETNKALQAARHALNQLIFDKTDRIVTYTPAEWRKVTDDHRSKIQKLEFEAQNLWYQENP